MSQPHAFFHHRDIERERGGGGRERSRLLVLNHVKCPGMRWRVETKAITTSDKSYDALLKQA